MGSVLRISPEQGMSCDQLTPRIIGRAATMALYDELALSPKPGLVTLQDAGSHKDMDAHTFMRSLFSLRTYFVDIAALGARSADFEELERRGLAAEKRMLCATGGINTHRGAIFTLGLLCAAAGALTQYKRPLTAELLRNTLLEGWGESLKKRALRPSVLPGGKAAHRYGLRSASQEASHGFPVLFETALPVMQGGLAHRMSPQHILLDTLFHVLAVMDDSNLAHRGGLEGLEFARKSARDFLSAGGASVPGGIEAAQQISKNFVARRLSPGGAADTLAAACLIMRLQSAKIH